MIKRLTKKLSCTIGSQRVNICTLQKYHYNRSNYIDRELICSNSRANTSSLSGKSLPVNRQTRLHFLPRAHATALSSIRFHPSVGDIPCASCWIALFVAEFPKHMYALSRERERVVSYRSAIQGMPTIRTVLF
jgi:hypothetical protein